jgi:integrase
LRFAPAPDYPTLSTDEFEKIISSIPDSWPGRRNVALYSLIFYTGARLGAIRLLKVKDVCTERQGIYIHILTKLNHEHYLDLPKIAADRLTQWLYEIDRNPDQYVFPRSTDRRLPLNPDQVSNVWPRYAKRAGIDKRCWVHGLRHSFATICCHAGVDLIVLQDLMGHANINQTAQYVYRSRDRRKDALKKVFG